MEVQLIPSALGDSCDQFLASALVNRTLAIDAGCIGLLTPLSAQQAVQHVLLTHAHLDHVATLPMFLDNVYSAGAGCPLVYGTSATWETLQTNLFNGRVWPDLPALSTTESRFLELRHIEPGCSFQIAGLRVTPVDLEHTVPTVGFVIEEESAAVAFVSDTGPTTAIWAAASRAANLKAVFLEASFPNRMQWLAEQSKHLTPSMLAGELKKLAADVRVIAVHLKPAFRSEIADELRQLGLPRIEVGVPGQRYEF